MDAIERMGLSDHVVYTDPVPDMPSLYNLADVVVFPILTMGLKFDVPLAVVEAMACAKPVVISDLPLLAEFSSAENAVVVRAGHVDDYLDAVESLARDESGRADIGSRARAFAEREFDIRDISSRYEAIYRSLDAVHEGASE